MRVASRARPPTLCALTEFACQLDGQSSGGEIIVRLAR